MTEDIRTEQERISAANQYLSENGFVGAVLVLNKEFTSDKMDCPTYMFCNDYLVCLRMLDFFQFKLRQAEYQQSRQIEEPQQFQQAPIQKPGYLG